MTCHNTVHCYGSETCLDTDCQNHPSHPFNRWGAGRPLVTTDGGEQVSGSIAIQLHRQVMPPEEASDEGDWFWYWFIFFASIGFVTLIAWSAA